MNKLEFEEHLLKLKASESGYPFGPDTLVFKVMNKMFALVSQKEKPARVTLKCRPADAEVLVAQYESIIPGYYMNKKHWITISLTDELPDHMLIDLGVITESGV
ncbi:MAG: MmcQ/YjbR family DNA-binding protein [Candidatus Thiodiazotropha sp. (ex Rostrolucina anterorostrata)]|nr:MmcQ/YjbR family DNA-binding protein [Candidatus Thiodiazotropha sp. (ex Rostrolucina anterorostrata)]